MSAGEAGASPLSEKGGRGLWGLWLRHSLSVRLAILLSLALVPLGVIAFEQERRLENARDRIREQAFHAITAEIARREGAVVERSLGAAQALAATIPTLSRTPEECRQTAQSIVEGSNGMFSFVGFQARDGTMRCASTGPAPEFSATSMLPERMEESRPFITSTADSAPSDAPAISVHHPVHDDDGRLLGHVTLSIATRDVELPPGVTESDIMLAVVDESGTPLGSPGRLGETMRFLPSGLDPAALAASGQRTVSAEDREGRVRDYAIEPIVNGVAYAVSTRPDPARSAPLLSPWPTLYPPLIWLASFVLIFGVIESSLMGPVRLLSQRIRRFGRTRELPPWPARRALPSELAGIEETFVEMAGRLTRDEERLLDAVHEQKVLLKEVHHRVKNNLQIISSMINLQVRGAEAPETERALERINNRIASLATVHRRLYQSSSVGQVEFDGLLRDVILTLMATAGPEKSDARIMPEIDTRLAPIRLTPDQSLPATMFAVEAMTNALKYVGPDEAGHSWITLTLEEKAAQDRAGEEAGVTQVRLRIASSGREPEPSAERAPASGPPGGGVARGAAARPARSDGGLGQRLIAGFARQLGGSHSMGWEGDRFVATLVFARRPFSAQDAAVDGAALPAE